MESDFVTNACIKWFCMQVCLCSDRGNDNWLIKYDMPDVDETNEDVS